MHKIEPHNSDANGDPAPSFATDSEIEFAERLRHQLEERYLAKDVTPAPSPTRSNEPH